MLQAIIFDVDGTLADTERAHLKAFNAAFAEMGFDWHWDELLYTKLLEISGGKERIRAYWEARADMPKDIAHDGLGQTISRLHELKTAAYEQAVRNGEVLMRPGVLSLIQSATDAGVILAIATTTSPVNISSLLARGIGANWRQLFRVIEDASTAPRKKPDPSVYLQTLKHLALPAENCVAIEDSANGLQAATQAKLATIITKNEFTEHHDFSGALRILPSLEGVSLDHVRNWHGASNK